MMWSFSEGIKCASLTATFNWTKKRISNESINDPQFLWWLELVFFAQKFFTEQELSTLCEVEIRPVAEVFTVYLKRFYEPS